MNGPAVPDWLLQILVASGLIGGLGMFIRMWILGLEKRSDHIDGCIDELRKETRMRYTSIDVLEEWRKQIDKAIDKRDAEWEEWRRHANKFNEDVIERRHTQNGQIQNLINRIAILETHDQRAVIRGQ